MKNINKKKILINALIFVALPIFINVIVESLGNKSLLGGLEMLIFHPQIFICNTLIIACTLWVGVFLRRYRYFWVAVISLSWFLLGLANFLLLSNRVLPLTANDLKLLDVLSIMMKKYLPPVALAGVSLLAVALLVGLVILFIKSRKPEGKYNFFKPIIAFALIVLLTYGNIRFATATGVLQTRFPELAKAYRENGFAYSFALSLLDNGVDKPDGYSKETIDSIVGKFEKTDESQIKKPNIIFLQLESFFDVNQLKGVKFSQNPIPNFTRLLSENPSGLVTVPTIGAGTVNTEFEIITGMRIADFGAGEYPYKTILTKSTCESLANNLKSHGYVSHFLHNYRGTFYGRNQVYANLGYDYFYAMEGMSGYEINENGWPKDNILTKYINNCLDSTTGVDLVNAVSVQAHGGYGGITDFERHLTVTECADKSQKTSYEFYANQLYEVDTFVGELMDSLKARDEEIILVVYGDHMPSFDLKDSDLSGRGIYETDYFIWNNMGIEYTDEDLYAWQIGSKILESIGVRDGMINSCHQTYKNDKNYSDKLIALEYDLLYGENYAHGGKNPYAVASMKVNARIMKITEVSKKDTQSPTYIVKGEGFTEKTIVVLGGAPVPTKYIDEHTLEFNWRNPKESIPISVLEKNAGRSEYFFLKMNK